MSTTVSGFREAGLCPFNPEVVLKNKVIPSLQFSSGNAGAQATVVQSNPVAVFESLIGEDKVKKFEQWFEEKYDIETDELYSVWLKIHDQPSVMHTTSSSIRIHQQLLSVLLSSTQMCLSHLF